MGATRLDDVTLYVPARNAAAWLAQCMESIARLDPAPAEVIVLYDDSSRDETPAIARAIQGVRAIAQPRPGLTAARNTAFVHARTRWVASVDADVLVAPDWLGVLWQARADLGEPAAISGRTEERITQAGDAFRALMMPHHWGAHVMRGPFMTISDALFDRDAVLAVGGYRESLERYGDDSRLSQDLRDAGYALTYTPHARALHIRTDSIASVLDLRWSYSEPRQRARLNDLEGLASKLPVNVEYGRMATARALEAGEPLLACVGALLPWHHALADCKAMLAQRTLLTDSMRDAGISVLASALWTAISASTPALASLCRTALPDLHRKQPARAAMPWPAFDRYVTAIVAGVVAWCEEVAPRLGSPSPSELVTPDAPTIARWSALLGGPEDARSMGSKWPIPRSAAPWRNNVAREVVRSDTGRPQPVGDEATTAFALESFEHPAAALADVVQGARRVGLSYTMPRRLKPGAEILLAVDLAEACASAGLTISSFNTLAGGVELWAERTPQ